MYFILRFKINVIPKLAAMSKKAKNTKSNNTKNIKN